MSIFAVICFLLAISVLVAIGVIDIFKTWRQRKLEELRRESWCRSIQTIATYCFYKGLSEGFEIDRDI